MIRRHVFTIKSDRHYAREYMKTYTSRSPFNVGSLWLAFAFILSFAIPVRSLANGLLCYESILGEHRSCTLVSKPYVHNGKLGTLVIVRTKHPNPLLGSPGFTKWRYFYESDCVSDHPIPIKVGHEDMSDLSEGWLLCPVENNSKSKRIIYNMNMTPLFEIPYIFIDP